MSSRYYSEFLSSRYYSEPGSVFDIFIITLTQKNNHSVFSSLLKKSCFLFFKLNFKNKQHGQADLCKLKFEIGTDPILYQCLFFLFFQQPILPSFTYNTSVYYMLRNVHSSYRVDFFLLLFKENPSYFILIEKFLTSSRNC